MNRIAGYEYSYRFRLNDDKIPNAIRDYAINRYKPYRERRVFFFEIRTNFKLNKILNDDNEDLIGSEMFDMITHERECEYYRIAWMSVRLKAYWIISDEEIEFMLSRAFDFAKQSAIDDVVIPVVVDLDICTVQLERETVDEAYDRAIRAEHLFPIYFLANHSGRNNWLHYSNDCKLQLFLRDDLEKIRVEDVDQGLALMDTCPICLRDPTVGTQATTRR